MESEQSQSSSLESQKERGTLAIDFGNSTTVIAFQGEFDSTIKLINLPPISRSPGEIPTLVWFSPESSPSKAVGAEVSKLELIGNSNPNLISDFKRWIGAPDQSIKQASLISPEEAGEMLIHEIWERLPNELDIKSTWKCFFNFCNFLSTKPVTN